MMPYFRFSIAVFFCKRYSLAVKLNAEPCLRYGVYLRSMDVAFPYRRSVRDLILFPFIPFDHSSFFIVLDAGRFGPHGGLCIAMQYVMDGML